MKIKFLIFAISILIACGVSAQLVKPDPPVKVTFVSTADAKAGSVVDARVEVEIQKDWHLFSEKPEVPGVAPTQILLDPSEAYTVSRIAFPKPTPVYSDVFGKTLNFYEDKISIPVQLQLKSGVKGDVKIKGAFRFQSCSKVVCLPPTKLPLTANLKIHG
ncbi:MAG TPA: protein-disulfide reductase DsbD N-terminal domain-containing protein [Acidobacteriota bacterium]|nr:protein-disulfide reductase DsbD N-terminal domain-containing protein [Acidobacteriota bacterium]